MTPLHSLAARIGLIVVSSLVVALLGAIAIPRLADAPDDGASLAGRIAALASVLEETPVDRHESILRAASSRFFTARIEPTANAASTPSRAVERRLSSRIGAELEALGHRPSSVTVSRAPNGGRGLEYRIALETGGTLVVRVGRRAATVLGVPAPLATSLFGGLVALAALLAMRRETRPIARLAAAVDLLDPSGPRVELPGRGSSVREIAALIGAFDRLQNRLAHLLRTRIAMLAGISHDIRTFTTRLRLRVDAIPDDAERERAVADIEDMVRLLDDALLATRAGAGELAEELVELDEIVRAEVDDRRAEGRAIELDAGSAPGGAVVLGDRLALRRVVANLLDNALHYGGAARIALESDARAVVLTIDDRGPGIPEAEREAVLEPFVRLETSRSRRTGGAGLGLAVARSLVDAHGGSIGIDDSPDGGARIVVRLPRYRSQR